MTSLLLFCGAGETLEKQPDVWSHLQLHLSQPQPLVFWAPEISRGTSWVWLIDFRVRTMKIGKWVYSLVLKTFEQVKLNGEYMLVWLQTNQKKKKKGAHFHPSQGRLLTLLKLLSNQGSVNNPTCDATFLIIWRSSSILNHPFFFFLTMAEIFNQNCDGHSYCDFN